MCTVPNVAQHSGSSQKHTAALPPWSRPTALPRRSGQPPRAAAHAQELLPRQPARLRGAHPDLDLNYASLRALLARWSASAIFCANASPCRDSPSASPHAGRASATARIACASSSLAPSANTPTTCRAGGVNGLRAGHGSSPPSCPGWYAPYTPTTCRAAAPSDPLARASTPRAPPRQAAQRLLHDRLAPGHMRGLQYCVFGKSTCTPMARRAGAITRGTHCACCTVAPVTTHTTADTHAP